MSGPIESKSIVSAQRAWIPASLSTSGGPFIRLALRFSTWKSLTADGLSDAAAARAVARSGRASCK
jgi:hypothetical protein